MTDSAVPPRGAPGATDAPPSHRMRHDGSILALAVSSQNIFAGTQGGEILVFCLDTYQRLAVIKGHRGSVLGLCLPPGDQLLLSSATDPFVNIWSTATFARLYALYSTYDVGDIFCVAYSSYHRTVYLGAQNTSIQWYDLKQKDTRPRPELHSHPSHRANRFFDSLGPGGVPSTRPPPPESGPRHAVGGQVLEIDNQDIRQFAHHGYVYCMMLTRGLVADNGSEEVLISGGGDGLVRLWRIDDCGGAIRELYTLDDGREQGESILSIVLDGKFLYTGRLDGEVNVWDLETQQLVRSLKTATGDVLALTIGGGCLFCGGVTGTIHEFGPHYETVCTYRAHQGLILASAFAIHDGKSILVTGGNDAAVVAWDSRCASTPHCVRMSDHDHMMETLREFISYRTVSSLHEYRVDCRRGAQFLRSVFSQLGAATDMLSTADACNPIVFAKFRGNASTAASRKRILFYGHYDVIAADADEWTHDPFAMTGDSGYHYGRGVSDNKGPVVAAIYAAHELTKDHHLDSDILFLIEGEEECGSRGFADAVRANKHVVGPVDWILVANSYWLDDEVPCLTYGLRGAVQATVHVESQHPDLHSGVDGSELLDEPLKDLVLVVSKLAGAHGKVHLPGFYDPVLPLTPDEAQLYHDITHALIYTNPALGDAAALSQSLMRRWREASLTVHRFHTSGPDNSTIIPRLARVAISLRLVPNQEAAKVADMLTRFLHDEFRKLDSANALSVTIDHQAEPWLGDYTNDLFRALEAAIIKVWGPTLGRRRRSSAAAAATATATASGVAGRLRPLLAPGAAAPKPSPTTSSTLASGSAAATTPPASPALSPAEAAAGALSPPATQARPNRPLYIREGGTIPAIRFLEKEFNAPAAHLPIGQASDGAHLVNERLRLINLLNGKRVLRHVFRTLGRNPAKDSSASLESHGS